MLNKKGKHFIKKQKIRKKRKDNNKKNMPTTLNDEKNLIFLFLIFQYAVFHGMGPYLTVMLCSFITP